MNLAEETRKIYDQNRATSNFQVKYLLGIQEGILFWPKQCQR